MRRQRGFTLVEVMVALSILAIAVVGTLELFTGSLRLAGTSASQTEALVVARSVMDEVLWRAELDDGASQVTQGNYQWSVRVEPIDPQLAADERDENVEQDTGSYDLKAVTVVVGWRGLTGPKQLTLRSARIVERY